jgi:F0F1-type ATP synthase alpha subunit
MMYAVQMGLGAMIYITSFINIGSGIQQLIVGDMQTYKQ